MSNIDVSEHIRLLGPMPERIRIQLVATIAAELKKRPDLLASLMTPVENADEDAA